MVGGGKGLEFPDLDSARPTIDGRYRPVRLRRLSSSDRPDIAKVQEIVQAPARGVHVEDEWALQYISISRIQPLLEAFDDDASSLGASYSC